MELGCSDVQLHIELVKLNLVIAITFTLLLRLIEKENDSSRPSMRISVNTQA